jgi:hypothetical protein
MLPDGCKEKRAKLGKGFSVPFMECWAECSHGYQEPNELRLSPGTLKAWLQTDLTQGIRFRDATVIPDNSIPDGIIEFHNTGRPNNPQCNGRVILEDFPEEAS